MSIAVSAVVKPSRVLLLSTGAACSATICIAAAIGSGRIGELPVSVRLTIFSLLATAGLAAFFYVFLTRKTFRIDISGIGQIRLTEYSGIDESTRQIEKHGKGDSMGPAELQKDSTLWPYLLLLRLRVTSRRVHTLVILPDSMERRDFKALMVACRWIAAHNETRRGDIGKIEIK